MSTDKVDGEEVGQASGRREMREIERSKPLQHQLSMKTVTYHSCFRCTELTRTRREREGGEVEGEREREGEREGRREGGREGRREGGREKEGEKEEERRECGVVCVTVSESAGRGKRGGGGASQEGAKGLSSPATSETTETGRERDTDPYRKIPSNKYM